MVYFFIPNWFSLVKKFHSCEAKACNIDFHATAWKDAAEE